MSQPIRTRKYRATKPIRICFEAHRKDGRVWAVQYGKRWYLGHEVRIEVDMPDDILPLVLRTRYYGPDAPQPRAVFKGRGRFELVTDDTRKYQLLMITVTQRVTYRD